ncbi:MAG TPA: DUF6492 family protein [Stellaceae bacterium]|nr:DUF6492 family protein [Stellaceae bacterium]
MSEADAGAIGAVLPLRVHRRRDAEIIPRCRILLASLAAFAEPGLFNEIHVVVPRGDRPEVERLCGQWSSLPLVVLTEDEYLSALGQHRLAPGWFRQQVIKLRAAERLKAPFFMTLDDDVILCKPLRRTDLLVGGRALLEPNPRTAHPDWWTGAAQLFGRSPDLSAPGMFVTPAILARTICLQLFGDLERRHDKAWAEILLRQAKRPWMPRWSEYALYYLAGEAAGMLADFHLVAGTDTPRRLWCPTHVWRKSGFDQWNVAECFDPEVPGFFTVVQSNLGISTAEIGARIAPYLKI